MLARFFIARPVFSWVIAIATVFAGWVSMKALPIAQYPEITPPTVSVTGVYPGASAKVVAATVAAPVEQQVNGVERMLYMSSRSTNDGNYALDVTFELGADLNMAQVLVQNRVALATPQLPTEVQRQGLSVKKKSPNILLVVNLYSPDGSQDQLFLSNYATIQIKDELSRIAGVGDIGLLGQQDYSMRAWLDPDALAYRKIMASDVVNAIKEQNVQVAAGQLGQEPARKGQAFQYPLSTLGRLDDAAEFERIVIKNAAPDGEGKTRPAVTLKDLAKVQLTAKNMDVRNTLDGGPSAGLAIYLLPGANALQTADRVKHKMKELRARFPSGLDYRVDYDTTPFIEQSVEEVVNTLRDAIILVAIVVLLFLQDWKSVLLPLISVPVSLVGTFAFLLVMGFSINNLTLFGLVLAIGIVVDDAIVVLENIEVWLAKGLDVREATIKAMDEITGPIVAITLVLCSVFLPSALITGITGQFYRQFALTISASMLISAINAMTLTPAIAVQIFGSRGKAHGSGHGEGHGGGHGGHEALPWWGLGALLGWLAHVLLGPMARAAVGAVGSLDADAVGWGLFAALMVGGLVVGRILIRPVNAILGGFFRAFNAVFDFFTNVFGALVGGLLRVSFVVLLLYGGLLFLTYWRFTKTPVGFVPLQDKGYLVLSVQLGEAAGLQRTDAVMAEIDEIVRKTPGVAHTIGISGQSIILGANASNFGSFYVVLDPFEERRGHDRNGFVIAKRIQAELNRKVQDATVAVFPPPPVDGLGTAGGFKVMVEDRGDEGLPALQQRAKDLIVKSVEGKSVGLMFTQFRADSPQMFVDVDRVKCKQMGVRLGDVFDTLQIFLGSAYVNDFNRFGRTWQVNVQADAAFRMEKDSVRGLKVRNDLGEMVPLGSLCSVDDSPGPIMVTRYNMYPAAPINGSFAPGVSTGTGMAAVDATASTALPASAVVEWTEIAFMQRIAGNTAALAFGGALVLVYLLLAAQYESWSMPLAVLLVVPMCILSSLVGVAIAGFDMDIFVQIGFVVLVGLASKNAILVVEFARQLRDRGTPRREATIQAAKLRLRPIVMTSFAFILGVVPLVISHGAGAEMRRTLGVAVFSGMLGVTAFGLLLTPVFFYVLDRLTPDKPAAHAEAGHAEAGHAEAGHAEAPKA